MTVARLTIDLDALARNYAALRDMQNLSLEQAGLVEKKRPVRARKRLPIVAKFGLRGGKLCSKIVTHAH